MIQIQFVTCLQFFTGTKVFNASLKRSYNSSRLLSAGLLGS